MTTRNRKCRLIIDSCCDLPADLVKTFDVEGVLSLTYIMDDGDHPDDLWKTMTPHEFYERLRKGERSTTSQVPPGDIQNLFTKVAKEGVPTVYLCFSSGLSGTYAGAKAIWNDMKSDYPDFELHIVDSKLASAAAGLLVIEAVRQCDQGLTAAELAAWIREARYYVHGYFTLASLETLQRGGRIPDMAGVVGSKLDIKPILSFDLEGNLSFFAFARGRKKAIKHMIQTFEERFDDYGPGDVLIASADAPKEQKSIAEQVQKSQHKTKIQHTSVGPVIGAHVGPEMLAIVFWGPDRRQYKSLADRIARAVSGKRNSPGEE